MKLKANIPFPKDCQSNYAWLDSKTEVLMIREKNKVRTFSSICPHMGAQLKHCGTNLVCPWHGLEFDLKKMTSNHPKYKKVVEFQTEITGDSLDIYENI